MTIDSDDRILSTADQTLQLPHCHIQNSHIDELNIIPFDFPGKNTAQTDEEKQRERQRNEREQKNAEIEAQNIKVSKAIVCGSDIGRLIAGI